MNIQTANQTVQITDFLAAHGIIGKPVGPEVAYKSPLRGEHNASFFVNPKKNRWYDFGEHCGGDVVELACKLYHCTTSEALGLLEENQFEVLELPTAPEKSGIEVISARPLAEVVLPTNKYKLNEVLMKYAASRGISRKTVIQYCHQIYYTVGGKPQGNGRPFFALGFPSEKGFELRSSTFKGCTDKGVSFFGKGSKERISVYEGFFDFLSCCDYYQIAPTGDVLILNGLEMMSAEVIEGLKEYPKINLYLDRDKAGARATALLLESLPQAIDRSGLYEGHKDFNQFWLHEQGSSYQLEEEPLPHSRQESLFKVVVRYHQYKGGEGEANYWYFSNDYPAERKAGVTGSESFHDLLLLKSFRDQVNRVNKGFQEGKIKSATFYFNTIEDPSWNGPEKRTGKKIQTLLPKSS